MTVSRPTLEEILAEPSSAWSEYSPGELLAAFRRSEPATTARSLHRFLLTVSVEAQQDRMDTAWLEAVEDKFLGAIAAEELARIVAHESELHVGFGLLERLSYGGVAGVLSPSLDLLVARLCRARPDEASMRAAGHPWTAQVRHSVEACLRIFGPIENAVAALERLFRGLGPRGMVELLRTIDALGHPDYRRPLALAMVKVPEASRALTEVWRERPSNSLAQLLDQLGREVAELTEVRPKRLESKRSASLPDELAIRSFVESFLGGLHLASPESSTRARAWFEAACDHHAELAGLVLAYLNSVPTNHEEVFDFLSSYRGHRSKQGSAWSGSSLTITEVGSMRSSSVHTTDEKRYFEPPEFEPSRVLARIGVDSAVRIICEQPVAEFLLKYVAQLKCAGHPQLSEICRRVFANTRVNARLNGATDSMAVSVLSQLDALAPDLHAEHVARRLFVKLLDRVPNEYMANNSVWSLGQRLGMKWTLVRAFARRLHAANSLDALGHLVRAGVHLGFRMVRSLRRLPVDVFALGTAGGSEGEDRWFDAAFSLSLWSQDLVRRILAVSARNSVFRLYEGRAEFGVAKDDDAVIPARLALKRLVVERMATLDLPGAVAALEGQLERDFWQWFRSARWDYRRQWLETVEAVCSSLVPEYLATLLVWASPKPAADPTLVASLQFVREWQQARSELDVPWLHETLLERLRREQERGISGASKPIIDATLQAFGCPPLPQSDETTP